MKFKAELTASSSKEFGALPLQIQRRLRDAIDELLESWPSFRPKQVKALHGGQGWRLRVGEYRAIFEVEDTTLVFTRFGHRSTIYRT